MKIGEGNMQATQKITSSEKSEKFNLEPMDPTKIEQVVEKYSKKHIQHRRGAVIFVGSGGGKSTTCRNQVPNSGGKTDLVDADLLYRETEAHPCQPGIFPLRPLPWWDMGVEVIKAVEKHCDDVNEAMVKHGLWTLTSSFTREAPYVPADIVVVMLPWEEQKRRIIEKSGGNYYDGGAKATETGFTLALHHRKWIGKVSKEKNIPIVDSIDSAIALIRSRETK